MADDTELLATLTEAVDRHVAANAALTAQVAVVFGPDAVDTAAQWFAYSLEQHAADIAQILAPAAAEDSTETETETETATETGARPVAAPIR